MTTYANYFRIIPRDGWFYIVDQHRTIVDRCRSLDVAKSRCWLLNNKRQNWGPDWKPLKLKPEPTIKSKHNESYAPRLRGTRGRKTRVKNLKTGEIFPSFTAAAKAAGVCTATIARRAARGVDWDFVQES